MNEPIGRNEPCHCGSGKKFKKCCLSRPAPSEQESSEWSRKPRGKQRNSLRQMMSLIGHAGFTEAALMSVALMKLRGKS